MTDERDNIDFDAAERILSPPRENEAAVSSALGGYSERIDPELVNSGWGFKSAKSVEHGKIDQSLVNHVRCGVYALHRVNEIVGKFDGHTLSEHELRDVIALFVLHDVHKLDEERDEDPESRFDIPVEEVENYARQFGLYEFAGTDDEATLTQMFHDCAVDHHDDWTANYDQTSYEFDQLRPFVRLADAFASSETPEQATDQRTQSALDAAYPGEDYALRHHLLQDVKGILTNLVNKSVGDLLGATGYETLLLYQDGCVYLLPEEKEEFDNSLDDEFIEGLLEELKVSVRSAHEAFQDATKLRDNLTTRSQGFYGINNQDFFYAGAPTVLKAVAQKGVSDANPDDDPTESMSEAMEGLEQHLPFDIDRSREPVGIARLVYTVKRSFVDPVLEATASTYSSLAATCAVFGVDHITQNLEAAANDEDLSLTAGGKWDYAYGIGQAIIQKGRTDWETLIVRVGDGLAELDPEWREIVEQEQAGNLQTELDAYLREIVAVDGHPIEGTSATLTDPFEEYGGSRRGKTCNLCNRGTAGGTKGDMKAPKSLTTLQSGYSNHIGVDSGKPDELLACVPCQIELSLRETGSTRREAGRLFFHLVPDYFYTPLSWRSYSHLTGRFSGNSRIEFGGLAESLLGLGTEETVLDDLVDSLFGEEYGRSMVETVDQGFDPDSQYGARTLAYFKPKDNDTEFQFFGVFLALAIGAYSGLRVAVSESPIPDVRGRDFDTFAHIGGGFTQVHDFYGTNVRLSELETRLRAASALIRLGYGTDRTDSLFAKYLRVTRNELLPGAHLLKRIAQTDDSGDARYLLEEALVLDETTGLTTDS